MVLSKIDVAVEKKKEAGPSEMSEVEKDSTEPVESSLANAGKLPGETEEASAINLPERKTVRLELS